MRPLSMRFTSKGFLTFLFSFLFIGGNLCLAAEKTREPVTINVVAVNPSAEKEQVVPMRIDLPMEVTPKDVLEKGDLELEYDEEHSIYYLFKKDLKLAPKETKVFEVVVRDLWFLPEQKLDQLKNYTAIVLNRLKKTEYYESAKQLSDTIVQQLNDIATAQDDETLSRKTRIGNYRRHLLVLDQVKEDLARMEKLLAFAGGPPVPRMLEESPIKSNAPSTKTTWFVIFLIIVFLGFLGGQFFLTWHRRVQISKNTTEIREAVFSLREDSQGDSTISTTQVQGRKKSQLDSGVDSPSSSQGSPQPKKPG